MINNIEEAIVRMEQAVAAMDARRDRRAVFLYAYLLITYNVRDRIRAGWFFDGEWLSRLAGKFAHLYFESLEAYDVGRPLPEAWRLTHDRVLRDRASVVENLALGINAHINYDLAFGIAENILEHGDQVSEERLLRRKFDHDRVNEVLARSTDQIQRDVPRRYRSVIPIIDILFGPFDEYVALAGLKAYRENVWSNVRYLLLAGAWADRDRVVAKINDEAVRNARTVIDAASLLRLRFDAGGMAGRTAALTQAPDVAKELSSAPFDFNEAVEAAARAAVPGLAAACVVDVADAEGLIRQSVAYPGRAAALQTDSRGKLTADGRRLDDIIRAGRAMSVGGAEVEAFALPLLAPGGVIGSLTLRPGEDGRRCAHEDAGEYARAAAVAIEAAAVGQALRDECVRTSGAENRQAG